MRYLIFILFVAISSFGFSLEQISFKGNISDYETGEAIGFASVYIAALELGTITDENGNFELSNALPKEITVRVTAQNYETFTIKCASDKFLSVKLVPTHVDFEEVVVSAPGSEIDNLNIFNVERININEGAGKSATNLSEAIANLNGVQSASIGPGISKPVIRGLQGLRVLTLINGVRMDNQQWGADHGMAIGKLGVGSAEIIKGPSSLLYGSDAFAGVVYLKDENFAPQNTQEIRVGTRFESAYLGSQSDIYYKVSKGNLRFSAGGLFGSYADFKLPNGKFLQNSRFKQQGAKATIAYNKGKWASNLRYTYSKTRAGIPGHTHDTVVTAESFVTENQNREDIIPTQIMENHIASWQNKWFLKKSEFQTLVSFTRNILQEYEEKVTIPALNSTLDNTLLNLKYIYNPSEKFNLIVGSQSYFQNHVNGLKWEEELIPNYNQLDNGVYALGIYKLDKIKFQFGARLDYRKLNVSSKQFKADYINPNFSFGLSNTDENNHFRLNLSSGYRPPHVSELFAHGEHHGALRIERGNANLLPEQSYQIDASFEKKAEHISVIINPHYSYLINYITLEKQDTTIENLPVFDYKQFDKAQLYGIDFSLHYHPHFLHPLHIQSGYSYVRANNLGNRSLSLIPQAKIDNFIQYKFEMKSKFKIDDINLNYQYFFAQDKISLLETKSPDYHLVNIGMNMSYAESFTLSCGVKNVFNTAFTNHLSRLKNINSPQEGINIYIQLKYTFKNRIK